MSYKNKIMSCAGLALYIVILFLVMTLYRLPVDKLIAATVENITKSSVRIKARDVVPHLFAGYNLVDVSYGVFFKDKQAKDGLKSLTLRPDYKRLLMGYIPINFKGIMSRGSISGRAGASIIDGAKNGYVIFKVSDIPLEDLNIIKPFSSRGVKGSLKGGMKIKGNFFDPSSFNGEGNFQVIKGVVDTRIDLPGLKAIPFKNISLIFSIKDGTILLTKGEIEGPVFSGSISGNIILKKNLILSRFKLKGEMRPGPGIEENKLVKQFIGGLRKGNNPVKINILGTFKRPSITWSKS